ncbi:hypothetical protein MOV08_28770 [Streptomyces yunnanensis]|uniref:Uncharacterized protein n=1 Tax=Streptomyces yunnanensis TaxID=156453 RepID=A0ABY8AH68_9ACTN|nr:hypothetical protein [Streptomyces yunnanensis]WEB42852.1 hypothetical protein MOV08_28770 [Streptomyces yunnanensis]
MPRECRPVHLSDPFPAPEPEPVAGCDVCAALAEQRAVAYSVGDRTTVIDRNVEMRRHPHARKAKS